MGQVAQRKQAIAELAGFQRECHEEKAVKIPRIQLLSEIASPPLLPDADEGARHGIFRDRDRDSRPQARPFSQPPGREYKNSNRIRVYVLLF